ncbi:putative mediator of RNA polymerase II transcription subunit 12 isoform X2 [Bacillus rossius redtenbacheri]|uniref:putative mediator of RNA polymerase II transcription subunit 12 isoform X1 n=1 Tax=Bacillus rossius redtenbacheri TaxID=93214 RepID=UPI002FDEDD84
MRITCLLLLGGLVLAAAAQADQQELIMLEIEALPRPSRHDKRAAAPTSQALYGASPGQFVVRSGDDTQQQQQQQQQPDVPQEYLQLLQQLLAQSRQLPQQPPVIQQLVVSRDPEPSVARFSTTPDPSQFLYLDPSAGPPTPAPAAARRPLPPEARAQQQLQQLYHDQRQTPRPPQQLSPSAAHSVHEARLRASLAGDNPDFLALTPPTAAPAAQRDLEDALFQQQLQRLAEQARQEQAQAQQSPFQQALQRQSVQPQVFPPAPQPTPRQPQYQQLEASTPAPRSTTAAPLFLPGPQQYLRETTRPRGRRPQQQLLETPRPTLRQQQQLVAPNYLSTPAPTAASHDDDVISSLLGQSAATTAATLPSRSSIFVSTTSTLKGSKSGSGVTIEELGSVPQEEAGDDGALPIVRLPTPEGQRPLTSAELQALIAAGFKVTPLGGQEEAAPGLPYFQQSAKRQRSYATPEPPADNQAVARQPTRKQEEKPQLRPQPADPELTPPSYQPQAQEPENYQPQDLQFFFQRPGGEQRQPGAARQPQQSYQPQQVQLVFQQQTGSSTQQPPVAYDPQEFQLVFQRQAGDQSQPGRAQQQLANHPQEIQLVYKQQLSEEAQKEQASSEQPQLPYQQLVYQSAQLGFQQSPIVVPEEYQAGSRRRPAGSRRSRQRSRGYRPASSQDSLASYDSEPAPSSAQARRARQRSRRPPPSES